MRPFPNESGQCQFVGKPRVDQTDGCCLDERKSVGPHVFLFPQAGHDISDNTLYMTSQSTLSQSPFSVYIHTTQAVCVCCLCGVLSLSRSLSIYIYTPHKHTHTTHTHTTQAVSTRRGGCPSAICRGGWQLRHSRVEPPDMYSSGEFNDNEVLYMTREGPLSIQRIECLLYTGECPSAISRGGRLLV